MYKGILIGNEITMSGKDRVEISKSSKKAETDQQPALKLIVSEGSTVVLDSRDLLKDVDSDSIKNYSWKQTTDARININGGIKDNSILSFTAPYVTGGDVNTTISFELTIIDKDGKTRNPPYTANVIVKRVQRAIIFQGGVALGAYEAGVYRAVVEKLIKNDEDRKSKGQDNEKRPLFDIVAGTSIGAMNSAIVVSSVTKNEGTSLEDPKSWEDSVERVIEFWRAQQQMPTYADFLDMMPFYHYWWDIMHQSSIVFKHSAKDLIELYSNMNPALKSYSEILASCLLMEPSIWKDYFIGGWYIPATAESRRRYYSAKQFLRTVGPFNVATGIWPWLASGKFFDMFEQPNYMPRADNKHFVLFSLKRTLERFAHFPIKTSAKEKQPRLLLVTVDVKTGDAVTFDSYSKEAKYHDKKSIISNWDGIEIEHALASGTFPDFFDYPKFKVESREMGMKSEEHIFWDGGFRSNTPLREVLQAHRDYWLSKAKEVELRKVTGKVQEIGEEEDGEYDKYENVVPDLEVYIADLWPSELKEDPISLDRDFVENKQWNLILGDKTDYDEQIASVVTDYIDLARRLKNLAEQKGASMKEISHILGGYATSINTIGKRRKYKELLEGRFRLTKVVHVDHKDDGNEVNDKVFDYSYKTIEDLMKVGYQDASVQMDIQRMKDGVLDLAEINGRNVIGQGKGKENDHIQKLEEHLRQIQEDIKIENSYDTLKQIDKIIHEVESTKDQNESGLSLKEQKALLINSAKRFQETIVATSAVATN